MNRRVCLILTLTLALALYSPVEARGRQNGSPARLFSVEIRNHSDIQADLILLSQNGPEAYHLSVGPAATRTFTVAAGKYNQFTYACGESATGTLEVNRQLRLVFTPCPGSAPNSGAPSLEKIHLTDAPLGILWSYQYTEVRPAFPTNSAGEPAAGSCQYTAAAEVTIYNRPDLTAQVFSTQAAGFSARPSARTADGWYGFDPGVAQAANIGVFRLRWLPPESGALSGGCARLPIQWTPQPGVCYDMPMTETLVYASPDSTSEVLTMLQPGDFAALTGTDPSGGWAEVDLGPGNTGLNARGWVESISLNINGPCSSLPTVTP